MKISITPPGGGTPFVLADDSAPRFFPPAVNFASGLGGVIVDGFLPSQTRMDQVSPLVRAAHPFIAPRYNVTNSMKFTVARAFSNANDCLNFLSGHADSVPVFGEITLQQQSSAGGLLLRYLPNCSVRAIECVNHTGASCRISYSLFAAAAWQTNP
jgi:hypothetical protein